MCPMCESEVYILLGNLGDKAWKRCRACGFTYSTEGIEGYETAEDTEDFSTWGAQKRAEERGRTNGRNLRRYGRKGVYR